ncbi:Eukaryotic translation initiation factor 4B [Nocardioides sp. AX2bis]|nr:Eukaryotic translation initiation factor 4B [Nocardioides sp. AX2bis]
MTRPGHRLSTTPRRPVVRRGPRRDRVGALAASQGVRNRHLEAPRASSRLSASVISAGRGGAAGTAAGAGRAGWPWPPRPSPPARCAG